MAHYYSFERLEVWKASRKLVQMIYEETKKFPKEELFGLTNQLRRAAISVSSNLAEGTSRGSYKEQARYTEIAYSSLMEVFNQLIISSDLNYLEKEKLNEFRSLVNQISNKLNKLKKVQIRKSNS